MNCKTCTYTGHVYWRQLYTTFTCVGGVNVDKPTKWEDELVEERVENLITIGKPSCFYARLS